MFVGEEPATVKSSLCSNKREVFSTINTNGGKKNGDHRYGPDLDEDAQSYNSPDEATEEEGECEDYEETQYSSSSVIPKELVDIIKKQDTHLHKMDNIMEIVVKNQAMLVKGEDVQMHISESYNI